LPRNAEESGGIVSAAPQLFIVEFGEKRWSAVSTDAIDLSIPLDFDGAQPSFFGAAPGTATALEAGSFIGDVRRGGSCNCSRFTLTPHCNGTHTECVGHVTSDRVSIRDIAIEHLLPALLVTVSPEAAEVTAENSYPAAQPDDQLITRKALQSIAGPQLLSGCHALIIRTLPNDRSKQHRRYDIDPPPPYCSAQAMQWIVDQGIRHLVVDLPSIDRAADAGRLTTHRLFWGLPPGCTDSAAATRRHCTITELAYVDNATPDGLYLLNLQVAAFVADAAPSRPILYPLVDVS
jgi:kynurenine formamidase